MPLDPISVISNLTSGLNASFAVASFIKDVKNTPTDIRTCFDLTARVEIDVNYLLSLRAQHLKFLTTQPLALTRLDSIINSTRQSIHDAYRLLEGCRQEVYVSEVGRSGSGNSSGGVIPIRKRMQWVLGDNAAFVRRTGNLQQQHAGVLGEIQWLRGVEVVKPLEELVVSSSLTTTFENLDLLNAQREGRLRRGGCAKAKWDGVERRDSDFDGGGVKRRLSASGMMKTSCQDLLNPRSILRASENIEGRIELEAEIPHRFELEDSLYDLTQSALSTPQTAVSVPSPMTCPSVSRVGSHTRTISTDITETKVSERTIDVNWEIEEGGEEEEEEDDDDDEDLEAAYYRDLRKQEDERRRRQEGRR